MQFWAAADKYCLGADKNSFAADKLNLAADKSTLGADKQPPATDKTQNPPHSSKKEDVIYVYSCLFREMVT
ncbi:hypothetical protein D9754_12530 [Planomicrobium sp. Y74]|nr:hypothetical protein D9754_12530 [Planomicrobium sp. Y74]